MLTPASVPLVTTRAVVVLLVAIGGTEKVLFAGTPQGTLYAIRPTQFCRVMTANGEELRSAKPEHRIPPHFHPAVEHITVLQGTFVLGMGDTVNGAAEKPPDAGSFAFMPAGMRHFVRTQRETIVQLHGIGPWGYRLEGDLKVKPLTFKSG